MKFEEIISIKSIGKQNVFDLSVNKNHNFILSNNIVIHNCCHTVWIHPPHIQFEGLNCSGICG